MRVKLDESMKETTKYEEVFQEKYEVEGSWSGQWGYWKHKWRMKKENKPTQLERDWVNMSSIYKAPI